MTKDEFQAIKNKIQAEYVANPASDKVLHLFRTVSNIYLTKSKLDPTIEEPCLLGHDLLEEISLDEESVSSLYYFLLINIDKERRMYEIYLDILPDDRTSKFTNTINRFKKNLKGSYFHEEWFAERLDKAIDNDEELMCMKLFYTLFTYYHDINDHDKNEIIVRKTRYLLEAKHPLWHYAYSEVLSKSSGEKTKKTMLKALSECKKCIDVYISPDNDFNPNYPGIYHAYAELIYETIEQGFFESNDEEKEKYLQDGLNAIEQSIDYNPQYAKYYYTKGRLISTDEKNPARFKQAKELINRAINMEDSTRKDYDLIRENYMSALTKCKNDEEIQKLQNEINAQLSRMKDATKKQNDATKELDKEIKSAQDAIGEEKKSVLEMLGFFSGIISIIIVTSQIVLALTAVDAMVLLLGFSGVLMLAFTFLRFVIIDESFVTEDGKKKVSTAELLMTMLGLAMIVVAVILLIVGMNYGWIKNIK